MFKIRGAWKNHSVPCAFSGYRSGLPHPHRGAQFLEPPLWLITDQALQSQIRLDKTKKKVLGWCPESAAATGFAATANSGCRIRQPGTLAESNQILVWLHLHSYATVCTGRFWAWT